MAVAPRTGPPTDYKLSKKIGQGGFGTVHQCCDQETGEELAVKTMNLPSGGEAANRELCALQNEMKLLKECQHERIVQYFGMARRTDGFLIFLELMPGGSVADQLKRDGPLKEPLALKYTQQILEGLAYLHSQRVIHRDVKGANVLRDIKGNVKLADFGVSKQMNMIADSAGMTVVGTRRWMAPEVLLGNYDFKADIWSVGCTVVEMLTGQPPQMGSLESILAFVLNPQPRYTLPPSTSEKTTKILKLAFQKSATDRPSASRLLRHFFGVQSAAGQTNIFPASWTPQSAGVSVKLVPLNPYSDEYKSVTTNFFARKHVGDPYFGGVLGRSTTIVSIERIQNPRLYQRYMSRKAVLDKQNPGLENEKTLFHGTPAKNIASINMHGIDPTKHSEGRVKASLCWYGDGAYFAGSACYSARSYIAEIDTSGHQRVYQCKVLVGYPYKGSRRLPTPPIRNGSVPYDSATDDVDKPGEYVIFQNDSAYPEYLITFKTPEYLA